MANLVEYVKTVWENGKTALNAARMNNIEQGISNCATQINNLGDSVSLINTNMSGGRLRFDWQSTSDGAEKDGLNVYVDDLKVAFFEWHIGM